MFHTRGEDDKDCTAYIPLYGWLAFLKLDQEGPAALAQTLEDSAKTLVQKWKNRNAHLPPGNERKPVAWSSEICRREWKNSHGKKETTVFEIHLNTYNLTQVHLETLRPDPAYDEVKVLIKARSSVNTQFRADQSRVDPDGLALDCRGYNKQLRHFLGYLRSQDCAAQHQATLGDYNAAADASPAGDGAQSPNSPKKVAFEVDPESPEA